VLVTFLEWMRDTTFSTALRESIYMWAILNGIHVLALGLFLGLLLFWDLRLLNVGLRKVPVTETWDRLAPWIGLGFLVMAITGILLFVSDPVRFWGNVFFRIKFVAMAIAGINALAFHFWFGRGIESWNSAAVTPTSARIAGVTSLALWAVIVISGRLIAYNWFPPLV
jgi:hypothetical protein